MLTEVARPCAFSVQGLQTDSCWAIPLLTTSAPAALQMLQKIVRVSPSVYM